MYGSEGVEATTVEGAGLDIGQRLTVERILAVIVEKSNAISRCANSDDLAASVIDGLRHRHDARPDLEECPHGGTGLKDGLVLLPVTNATEGKHDLQSGLVERLAEVEGSTNASITG